MFNGVEVDMLDVCNADCILVTKWTNGVRKTVLIDGGNKGDIDALRSFLDQRELRCLDAVVCTHPHDDHAAGILELVKDRSIGIGRAYLHIPQRNADLSRIREALRATAGSTEAACMQKSLQTAEELYSAFNGRGIPVTEPFAGIAVEFLFVVGPSQSYYQQLMAEYASPAGIQKIDAQQVIWSILHDHAVDELDTELPENPQTTPENNSSVALAFAYQNGSQIQRVLFTSDAGVPALQNVAEQYDLLRNLHYMQIPHHGSRRNINPALIKLFSPKYACVSAEGSKKHPRHAVVNAFKQAGALVYSTHYPEKGNLWLHLGVVPPRSGYGPVAPLYERLSSRLTPPPQSQTLPSPQSVMLSNLFNYSK
jgi:beta-lactamase superfamily II metal-dependent hydrolase